MHTIERKKRIMDKDYNSYEYKRSRGAYMAQCTFEYFVSLLVADAFLAKLLSSIGISDALIGIISSFISMAFVIQIMSVFLIKVRVSTKKLVIVFDTVSQIFFMALYLVPFFPLGKTAKTVIIILSILIAYAGKYLIASIYFKWANSYVDPTKRASYSAVKEIISLILGIIFTAVVGYVIDKYESIGNLNGSFLFIAASMLIINICNVVCLMMIKKEAPEEHSADNKPLCEVIKHTLGNKNFRNVIILAVLWDSARFFTIGFMGIFKTKDLLISVFAVQIINMIGNLARITVSKAFGRYSDKNSFVKGFKLSLYFAAAAFFVNIFTSNSCRWLIVVYTILYNISMAGTNQNSFNIIYSYVESEYITQAMAFKNSIGGICGFVASIAGGKILSHVQANNNMLFGINIYGQQLLSAISFLLVTAAIIFIKKTVEKQEILIQ